MRNSRLLLTVIGITIVVMWNAKPGQATAWPGPDAFGYHGVSIGNNLRHISATGTQTGGDDISYPVPLGFNFNFYGNNFTQAFISTNGFLSFTNPSHGCCNGQAVPGASIENLVAGSWFDLISSTNPYYQTLGAPGSREFVAGYYNDQEFCCTGDFNFEIILHEGTNDIELQYGHMEAIRHTASVGIQDGTRTVGLQLLYGQNLDSLSNQGFCIGTEGSPCATTGVPEPATATLVGIGLAAAGVLRCRYMSHVRRQRWL